MTTDGAGRAAATIDLSSLPAKNQTEAGDTLSVEAEFIGPTRERVLRSKGVP